MTLTCRRNNLSGFSHHFPKEVPQYFSSNKRKYLPKTQKYKPIELEEEKILSKSFHEASITLAPILDKDKRIISSMNVEAKQSQI
jgi:hypothetical protein